MSLTKIALFLVAIPSILLILNQEFVLDKTREAWNRETVIYDRARNERITPGRIGSLILDIDDFQKNPIIGYGLHVSTRYHNFGRIEQQRTNGLTDYLVKFGLIGFLIMVYNFYKTFSLLIKPNGKENVLIFIFALFLTVFAQVVLVTPIFFALQFYHLQFRY
jgi:hypothetical protein